MKSLQFEKGEICIAGESSTAYKIREGSMDVFLVPYKAEHAGRRVLIYEAKAGETVPGFDFTDREHTHWVFCFRATENLALTEIDGGVTNVLKKKFAARAGLKRLEEEGFEYSAIEKYNEQKIKEDLDISQKEEETARAAEEKKRTIERMASVGNLRKERNARSAATLRGSGMFETLGRSIGEAASFSRAHTETADRLWITLLSAGAAMTGILMLMTSSETGFVCFALAFLLFTVLKDRQISQAAILAGSKAQEKAFGALFELEEVAYRQYGKTELAALCMNVYGIVKQIVYSAFCMGSGAFVCAVMFVGAILKQTSAGLLFLLVSVTAGVLITAGSFLATKYSREAARSREKANTRLYHYLRNINKIKVSGSEENIQRDYFNLRADKAVKRLRTNRLMAATEAMQVMVIIAVIPISAFAGNLPVMVLPLAVLGGCWIQTMQKVSMMPQMESDLNRVRIILKEKPKDTKTPVNSISSIVLEDVWFSYGQQDVIKEMKFEISKGETVGLVGESGSGKTTLLKLITGIEQPTRGVVRINGIDAKAIDMRTFRKRIGIVSQDEVLTSASLVDNIRMGSGASAEEVFSAIVKAGLADFVSALPMGVDTLLSEEGESISYGQKQKIFIARVLVRKPDLIILDEAMSEMDNESIEDISDALNELDAAIIIVSHRIEPLKYCDKIVVTE